MKRVFTFLVTLLILSNSVLPANATKTEGTVIHSETLFDNGITIVDEVTDYSSPRSIDKVANRSRSFYDGDTLIAVIAFNATFRYDGTNVIVVSKTITQTDTYSGWSFAQDSFTSSGGTVTLAGKLKFLLLFNSTAFTMELTCDKNGNIAY